MKSLVAGLDSKEGSKEADEAAKAVESLSVGEKATEGEAPKENL